MKKTVWLGFVLESRFKSFHPIWKPVDLKELDSVGRLRKAITPAAKAATDAKTKAGKFPPPNNASHGPAPRDTIICLHTKAITQSLSTRLEQHETKIMDLRTYLGDNNCKIQHSYSQTCIQNKNKVMKPFEILKSKI